MHIVYVTDTLEPQLNGAALSSARTVRHLRGAGHQVQVLRPHQAGECRQANGADEQRCATLPLGGWRCGWISARTLRRQWRQRRPALVHAATPGPLAFAALRAAKAENIPASVDFRVHLPDCCRSYRLDALQPLAWRYLRHLHQLADCSFVPTAALAEQLGEIGFERLHVLGGGVDTERFTPRHRSVAQRLAWGAAGTEPVLLYVGRLTADKNVPLALHSYEQLRRVWPMLRMVVVGDGPLREPLQARHPSVHFVGSLDGEALARHYASADVLLFPSRTATFGHVTLEALASGLAVVAFRQGAAAQYLRDGVNGWLAELGDPGGFLGAACRAVASLRVASSVRSLARVSVLHAGWEPLLNSFEQQLRLLAQHSQDPRSPGCAALA